MRLRQSLETSRDAHCESPETVTTASSARFGLVQRLTWTIGRNISQFNLVDQGPVSRAIERLDHDLSNGDWDAEYRSLRSQDSEDLGYCILVAEKE
jgi:hypothetical protein